MFRQFAGAVFKAKRRHLFRGRAEEHHAFTFTAFNKTGIFAQKTVTWMYRLDGVFAHDGEQFVLIEIGFANVAVAQRHGNIRLTNVLGVFIRFGIHRDSGNAHLFQGADNAHCNRATVGNKNSG